MSFETRERPLLSLVMIVRNEARAIARTIESCRGVVDRALVLDTGSTDGTPGVVEQCFRAWSEGKFGRDARIYTKVQDLIGVVDYLLLEEGDFVPFYPLLPVKRVIDYAATRNRALDLEGECLRARFTLTLSGDEVLEEDHPGALREFLASRVDAADGAYSVEMRQGHSVWPFPRVLRADAGEEEGAGWRYEGAVHEVPVDPASGATGSEDFEGAARVQGTPCVPGVRVVHAETDPARHLARVRDRDLPVLEWMARDPAAAPYKRARAVMYLAQTHEEVAESFPDGPGSERVTHRYAAMAHYRRLSELCRGLDVVAHPDARAYVDFADFHYLSLAERVDLYSPAEMVERLKVLAARDPRRPEVKYMLAANALKADEDARVVLLLAMQAADAARAARERPLPLPTDPRVEWLALRIACAAATGLSKEDLARKCAERALAAGGPPEAFAAFTRGAAA